MKTAVKISSITLILGFLIFMIAAGGSDIEAGQEQELTEKFQMSIDSDFGDFPLYFITNKGQVHEKALYYARTPRFTLWLTHSGLVFDSRQSGARDVSRMVFIEADEYPKVFSADEASYKVNYFQNDNPEDWITGISTSKAVYYENLYQGIDLKVYGTGQNIQYDWVVNPGGEPESIRFAFDGVDSALISDEGCLVIKTEFGEMVHQSPVTFQIIDGEKKYIESAFKTWKDDAFGFEVGEFDQSRPLYIDPLILIFSTYLGGNDSDTGYGVAVDSSGNSYITGRTQSSNFPLQNYYMGYPGDGTDDVFVTKMSVDGTSLVYSTYIGATGEGSSESGYDIAVDSSGCAYVVGETFSSNFPTVNPYMTNAGGLDAFVCKLSQSGDSLVYSTYLGGSGGDSGRGIAVDSSGYAYVTGYINSNDYPTANPYMTDPGDSSYDAFVTKLSQAGNSLEYSTYLGGSSEGGGNDFGTGIDIDGSGCAYVTGDTMGSTFPLQNEYMTYPGSGENAFVTKFSAAGNTLIFSTYLGGTDDDYAKDIAVDASGCAYVTGYTESNDFPMVNAYQGSLDGYSDAFVTKFSAAGNTLEYSTYIGGEDADGGYGIDVDSNGCAFITGETYSYDYPEVDSYMSYAGSNDAFVTKFSAAGNTLEYSTFLGGGSGGGEGGPSDYGKDIAFGEPSYVYVTGYTESTDFPTVDEYMSDPGDSNKDAFVAKFSSCIDVETFSLLSPENGAADQDINVQLDWEDAPNATSYDVYFGTTYPASFEVNVLDSFYEPGPLAYEQTYYWRIVAKNECSEVSCCEWVFTTTHSPTIIIDGTVTCGGSGLAGVALTGLPAEPSTSGTGYYTDIADYGWSGTVIPALAGYSFVPMLRTYANETSDQLNQDYAASLDTYTISGTVFEGSSYLDSVVLTGLPGTPATDGSGLYSDSVPYGWSGTVTPVLTGYRFNPASRSYSSISSSYTEQNYYAFPGYHSSPSEYQVVPEVLWAPATGGGTWITEVQITDLTGGSEVSVYFNSGSGDRRGPISLWTGGRSETSVKFDNLLETLDGLDSGFSYFENAGAVEFFTQDVDHRINVIARTSNGNYSKTFAGLNCNDDNTAGAARVMMVQNLESNNTFRTAFGGFNPTDDAITVDYEIFDESGTPIGITFSKTYSGRQYQGFDPFAEAGVPFPGNTYENAWVKISHQSGTGKLMSYGATANNITSDPAVHFAVQEEDISGATSPSDYLVIPEVLWAPALGFGTWMTELQITDLTGGTEVTVYFNSVTGERRGPLSLWTGSGADASVKFTNLMETMESLDSGFSYYGLAGAVEFFTQDAAHQIQVIARTRNGNYSKTFSGLPKVGTHTAGAGRTLMVQNMESNATYRTAFGAFNPTNHSVTAKFTLIDGNGGTIGSPFTRTFSGRSYQAFTPFNEAGVPYPGNIYDNTWIKVEVTSGSGELMVYGATANNHTNDPAVHRAVQR